VISANQAGSLGPREKKGPFGLTTLYPHDDGFKDGGGLVAHVIFVHGLAGGSESTWTKNKVLWPRDLLPLENGYQDVAVHSFGYDSDFKVSNFLNIADFSRSLLASLEDNPLILKSTVSLVG
jgi:hypothetical protein